MNPISQVTEDQLQGRVDASILKQRIIPSMVLAPSAHNTQPWSFVVREGSIDILIAWDRHLQVSDPTHRQLYVSLGCAIYNARVAAAYWGYNLQVQYFPRGKGEPEPVVRLVLDATAPAVETAQLEEVNQLFTAIENRRTDRSLYIEPTLTSDERQRLKPAQGTTVLFTEDREVISKIATISEAATFDTLSRHDFKTELSHWVRNSWTRQPDGMPGYAMGMPAPISLVSPWLVRLAPIHKQEGPKTRQQFESASAVAVIATAADTPTDWLKAGEDLERLWLYATVAGLAVMPIAAGIEASNQTREHIQQALGTNLLPQAIMRLGHNSKALLKATPRRSLENCLA